MRSYSGTMVSLSFEQVPSLVRVLICVVVKQEGKPQNPILVQCTGSHLVVLVPIQTDLFDCGTFCVVLVHAEWQAW